MKIHKKSSENKYYTWVWFKDTHYNIEIDGVVIVYVKVRDINNIPSTLLDARKKVEYTLSLINKNLPCRDYKHYMNANECVLYMNKIDSMIRTFKIEEIFA